MTTGYVINGRGDLDALFKARTSAAIGNTGFRSNGNVDLAQRFEPRGATTPISDTGFKSGVTDLAALFMSIAAAANTINVPNANANAFNSGSAGVAQYQLNSSGFINLTLGTNTIGSGGPWITPQTNMSAYSVRATIVSGAFTSGTFGTYLNLGTSRLWTLSGGGGGVDATMSLEIRNDADGLVKDTATIVFHAERDV